MYQKPQSYVVQFLRYPVRQIFLSFWAIFALYPFLSPNNPENQNFEKSEKSIWRCHHFKLVQQTTAKIKQLIHFFFKIS